MSWIARAGVLLLLLLTPWPLGSRLPWASTLSTAVILALGGCWLATRLWTSRAPKMPPVTLPVLAFLGWVLLQIVMRRSVYPFGSALEAAEYAGYAAMMLLVASLFATPAARRVLTGTLLASVFAVSVFGIVQHFTWNGLLFWSYESPFGGTSPFGPFNNRNYFAGYVAAGAGPAFAVALGRASWLWRLPAAVVAVTGASSVVISLARGGILAIAAGLLVAAGLVVGSRWRGAPSWNSSLRRVGPAALVLVVAAGAVVHFTGYSAPLIERFEILTTPGYDRSVLGRLAIWADTVEMIKDRPIMGFGLDTFAWAHLRYRTLEANIPQHAHNEYLEMLAETGLVGGGVCAWFLWLLLGRTSRVVLAPRDGFRYDLARGALASWAAILVFAVMDFPSVVPATNYALAALAGLALSSWRERASVRTK